MAQSLADIRSTDTFRMPRRADGAWKSLAKALSGLSLGDDSSNRSVEEDEGSNSTADRRSTFLNGTLLEEWFTVVSSFESAAIEFSRSNEESTDDFVGAINKLAWPQMNKRRHDLLRKRHAGSTQLTLTEARELSELQGALNVQLEPHYRGANQSLDLIISQLEERLNDEQRDNIAD